MRRMYVVLAAVLPALAVGCGSSDKGDSGSSGSAATAASKTPSTGSGKAPPVTIGVAASLSGPISAYDAPYLAGIQLAVDDLNAKGGQYKIVKADNKTDLQLVKQAAQKVLDKGANVVVTTCDYDFGSPAAKVANDAGKISFSCGGTPLFGAATGPLVYNTWQGTPGESAGMATFAAEQGYKKPYYLVDQALEYDKTLCKYFKDSFEAQVPDAQTAGEDTFQNADTSVASQVTKIKNSGADVVILCSHLPGGATAIKQMRSGGVKLPIVSGLGFDGTAWAKAIPNLTDFYAAAVVSMFGDDPSAAVNQFWTRFKEKTGSDPQSSLAILGYTMVQLIDKGVKEAGSADGKAVSDAFNKFTDVPAISGATTWTPACHIDRGNDVRIIGWKDGKASLAKSVTPKDIAKAPC